MRISGLVLISFLLCSVLSAATFALADTNKKAEKPAPLKSKVNVTSIVPVPPKIVKQIPILPNLTKQTPIKPKIVNSTPTKPEISKSLPVKPTAIKPTPVTPTKVKPMPVTPTKIKPTPIKPTPVTPTKVKPTLIAPTPIKQSSLSGKWTGSAQGTAVFADINGQDLNCRFTGHATLDLKQTGDSLTGSVAVTDISLAGDGCEQVGFVYNGDLKSTIFGSGFSGTIDTLNVSGQFTSDLMKAKYNGNVDANAVSGELTVSRAG